MLPSKTPALKLDCSGKGYKNSKGRVTITASSNPSDKHKFPLILIGESKYQSLKNAWMKAYVKENNSN